HTWSLPNLSDQIRRDHKYHTRHILLIQLRVYPYTQGVTRHLLFPGRLKMVLPRQIFASAIHQQGNTIQKTGSGFCFSCSFLLCFLVAVFPGIVMRAELSNNKTENASALTSCFGFNGFNNSLPEESVVLITSFHPFPY